jgi:hypothetical protein
LLSMTIVIKARVQRLRDRKKLPSTYQPSSVEQSNPTSILVPSTKPLLIFICARHAQSIW